MGFFNTHFDFNPFNGGFDATPFFNLGVSNAAKQVTPTFGVSPTGQQYVTNQGGQVLGDSITKNDTNQNQPNYTTQNTNLPNNTNSYIGGGVGSASGLTPEQQAANQQAIDIANSALGRLPGQLQNAKGQIQRRYDQNFNELQSSRNQANQSYDQSSTQNQQQLRTNKNSIFDNASTGLRSLLRILGQHGAGGGSAALFSAPDAVQQGLNRDLSGASQNFGENQQALDTNWNNYLTDYGNSKKRLADWLTEQNSQADIQSENARQNLLSQLARLQPTTAAAQPYIDQINASADLVNRLGNFNPTYTGKSPLYTAPELTSYTAGVDGAPILNAPNNNTGASTPALAYLLGLNKDKQQQPTF